jgi:diguanylate cyclase (GGDEF)-like protein
MDRDAAAVRRDLSSLSAVVLLGLLMADREDPAEIAELALEAAPSLGRVRPVAIAVEGLGWLLPGSRDDWRAEPPPEASKTGLREYRLQTVRRREGRLLVEVEDDDVDFTLRVLAQQTALALAAARARMELREASERAISLEEERYRRLADAAEVVAFEASRQDGAWHLDWISRGLTALTGVEPEAACSRPVLLESLVDRAASDCMPGLEPGSTGTLKLRIVRPPLPAAWVDVEYRCGDEDETGRILLQGFARDVTDRVRGTRSIDAAALLAAPPPQPASPPPPEEERPRLPGVTVPARAAASLVVGALVAVLGHGVAAFLYAALLVAAAWAPLLLRRLRVSVPRVPLLLEATADLAAVSGFLLVLPSAGRVALLGYLLVVAQYALVAGPRAGLLLGPVVAVAYGLTETLTTGGTIDVVGTLALCLNGLLVVALIGSTAAVDHRRALEAEEDATHDPLTGLGNRNAWLGALSRATTLGTRPAAIVVVDLDGLKLRNDRDGHAAGDRYLISAARALASATRAGDTTARLGGDEFGVLALDATDRGELLAARLAGAFEAAGVEASIGVAACEAQEAVAAWESADRSMYTNKWARKAAA